ncbi:hypothetical protein GCM10010294_25090 [Streptomyces griseoloalbus]|uniref:hypothetical protein n=1 Tax=Streptomyces griseoloalbus TaxID=67303 RepID=UPI001876D4F4|nr:hypothetical protein GCM10010294_25090 [Streptomyces griseoloalbus]
MAFRRSIPQAELRAAMTEEQLQKDATHYQEKRGGYFPPTQAQRMNEETEAQRKRARQ